MHVRRSLTALASLVLCLLALGAAVAMAATPGEITTFQIPGCPDSEVAFTAAPQAGVLIRLCDEREGSFSSTLANLLPDGTLVRRAVPTSEPGPIATGPAGEIWLAAINAQSPAVKGAELSIDRIAADGSTTTFPLGSARSGRTLKVYGVAPDGRGGLWVATGELTPGYYGQPTNSAGGELVHVVPGAVVQRFPLPRKLEPRGLVVGPDGNVWFTAVSDTFVGERTSSDGAGFIGQMTPNGRFALFLTPIEESGPAGIVVGPDGLLWFAESAISTHRIGTIATDGKFGPAYKIRGVIPQGPLTFGPEGDAWFPAIESGLMRLTPAGQETLYPNVHGTAVAGPEGDIWSFGYAQISRIVPGGPGIDVWAQAADRQAHTFGFTLACGGSSTCEGTLELTLAVPRYSGPLPNGAKKKPFPFARIPYSVGAESATRQTIEIPAKVFTLARRYAPEGAGGRYPVPVQAYATVAGGPTLERRLKVPSLLR
ncbi:MAG TPA: hypothetical protein VJL81_00455 [Solirubrobacterales bacterium]|nr:hypothetical protein [Solirubrobacterales bacterium]